ncbi:MAG: hypothetical protein CMP71_05700 [Flavobacteriales bacterium]|nr:hypothetical protein [Flavobacteriales bacterium]
MTNKKIKIIHSLITILVALFFVNAGYKKFTSKKMKPLEKTQVVEYIFENDSYEAPVGYNIVMNTFKQSGFLGMIAIFQIIAGILMIVPKTRLFGLLFLLPMIFNIFFMHVFFDNRVDENIETGILLALNILLLLPYSKIIRKVFDEHN